MRYLARAVLLLPAKAKPSGRSDQRAVEELQALGLLAAGGELATAADRLCTQIPREHLAALAACESVAQGRAILSVFGVQIGECAGKSGSFDGEFPDRGGKNPKKAGEICQSAGSAVVVAFDPSKRNKNNSNNRNSSESEQILLALGVDQPAARRFAGQFDAAQIKWAIRQIPNDVIKRAGWLVRALQPTGWLARQIVTGGSVPQKVDAVQSVRPQSGGSGERKIMWPAWREIIAVVQAQLQSSAWLEAVHAVIVDKRLLLLAPNRVTAQLTQSVLPEIKREVSKVDPVLSIVIDIGSAYAA